MAHIPPYGAELAAVVTYDYEESYLECFWHVRTVWDVQIWKLTFHPKGMASEIGLDGNCRCNLATALLKPPKLEKIKKVLAKALT